MVPHFSLYTHELLVNCSPLSPSPPRRLYGGGVPSMDLEDGELGWWWVFWFRVLDPGMVYEWIGLGIICI